jgi:membrane-bound ClpP family serine protease
MTLSIIIALVLVGILLLILEILVIPGAGFAGIIGFILIAIGIYYGYSSHGTLAGSLILAGAFVLSVLGVYLSVRSKTWKSAMLDTKIEGKSPTFSETELKKGDHGIAVGRLAPAGTAMFGEIKTEVHTLGDFVNPGTEIEIIKIDHQKIIVKPLNL